MAEHPAFTLAGLLAGGGTFGFYRTRSKPSLIAGLTLGASFACAGYLLKKNKDYGAELALGSSVLLLGAGAQRMIATQAKSPPAIGLSVAGALSTYYYQKKFREFRFGV
ncbi:transmembrane protein 14C [Colletotrichum eremochloae]|nr:transmembrane protein 14C [Colletotrichum sublineola]KAK2010058.1 transmembrane protein 14C [Colletotrichum eremochloae]